MKLKFTKIKALMLLFSFLFLGGVSMNAQETKTFVKLADHCSVTFDGTNTYMIVDVTNSTAMVKNGSDVKGKTINIDGNVINIDVTDSDLSNMMWKFKKDSHSTSESCVGIRYNIHPYSDESKYLYIYDDSFFVGSNSYDGYYWRLNRTVSPSYYGMGGYISGYIHYIGTVKNGAKYEWKYQRSAASNFSDSRIEIFELQEEAGTTVPTPTFTPAGGTYTEAQSVAINCENTEATIYYTTDGNDPRSAESRKPYQWIPLNITETTTLKAAATLDGNNYSEVAEATYIIEGGTTTIPTPTFTPAGGTYTEAVSVTIEAGDAYIFFTTNGSDPSDIFNYDRQMYMNPISLSATTTIRAAASFDGENFGDVVEATYTINLPVIPATPTITLTPAGGEYITGQEVEVSITSTDSDAIVRYTLDETEPTENSEEYGQPLKITETKTVKAKAFKTGLTPSSTATATLKFSAPSITVQTSLSGFEYSLGAGPSQSKQLSVNAKTLNDLTVSVDGNFEISKSETSGYGNTLTITPVNAAVSENIYVRMKAGLEAGDYNGTVTLTSTGATSQTVALSGKVVRNYEITYKVNGADYKTVSVPEGEITLETEVTSLPEGFEFKGWTTTDFIGMKEVVDAGILSSINVTDNITLYAVFGMAPQVEIFYEKCTSMSDFEDGGDYLIVYEAEGKALNGALQEPGVKNNCIYVDIVGNTIKNTDILEESYVTISSAGSKYTILSKSGKYLGLTGYTTEGIQSSASIAYNNTISIDDNVSIRSGVLNCLMGFETGSNNRFSYYYDAYASMYPDFKPIQLYKKVSGSGSAPSDTRVCTSVDVKTDGATVSTYEKKNNVFVNGTVTIGGTLEVEGEILNTATDGVNLIIKDGGQLIHNNAGVMATVEQNISGWSTDAKAWQVLSSPMKSTDVANFIGSLSQEQYDLYKWVPNNVNEGVDEPWYNQKSHATDFTNFDNGVGYLVSYENTASFNNTGELNFGTTHKFTLSEYNAENNWSWYSLLGNPFAYDITWEEMSTKNNLYRDGYAVVNDNGAFGYDTDGKIAVGEGFMVKALAADASLVYTKGAKRDSEDVNKINVIVEGTAGTDNTVIVMNNNKGGFEKLVNINDKVSTVFVTSEDERYGIYSCSEDITSVPVGFKANTMGEFSLRLETEGEFDNIYLIDNATGEKVNMMMEESYEFVGMPNSDTNRFTLVFNSNDDTTFETDKFAYTTGNVIVIDRVKGAGEVKVIDITGRIVITANVTSGAEINVETLSAGVYVLRMVDESGVKTQKVLVK